MRFFKKKNYPKNDKKNSKIFRFLTFLCNFCQIFETSWIRMLKTLSVTGMAGIRCPVCFSEEIMAVF